MANASNTRNAKPGYLTSSYLQHHNPLHQPSEKVKQVCPFSFALEESASRSYCFPCHWRGSLMKLRINEWLRLGRRPGDHTGFLPCSRLPKNRFRLTFVLAWLFHNADSVCLSFHTTKCGIQNNEVLVVSCWALTWRNSMKTFLLCPIKLNRIRRTTDKLFFHMTTTFLSLCLYDNAEH